MCLNLKGDYMKKGSLIFIVVFLLMICSIMDVKAKSITGIVSSKNAYVQKSSVKNSKTIYILKQGTSVNIVGIKNGYYIVAASNNYGYVKKSSISLNYILVDISDQKLYVYKNGLKKWNTNVVTGKKGVSDTPCGHYVLQRRNFKRKTHLMGNAYVEYWMPFITSRGIGFHDASWRSSSSFNSKTYLTNGSHGCVNMKKGDAKKLFENAPSRIDVLIRK